MLLIACHYNKAANFVPSWLKWNTDTTQLFPVLDLEQLYKIMQCNFSQTYPSQPTPGGYMYSVGKQGTLLECL